MKNKPLTSVPEAARCYNGLAYLLAFVCVLFLAMPMAVWGQTKEYATWAPSGDRVSPPGLGLLPGDAGVENMPNAAIANDDNHAVMIADRGLGALGIVVSGGDAYLQLKFPTNRSAGATTYVRVDAPQQSGLGLNLGQLLGLVGSSVSSNVYIGAGNNPSSTGTLVNANVTTRLVQDDIGNYF